MGQSDLPKHVQLHIEALEDGLTDSRLGATVDRMIKLGTASDFEWNYIESFVHRSRTKAAYGPPFREPPQTRGRLLQGTSMGGRKILFNPQLLNQHCITNGGSGCGKTVKSYFLILQLACILLGLWLFDLRKREFSILRPYLARLGIDLILLPARQMRLNLLQVPRDTDPRCWAEVLADGLVGVLQLPLQASKLLLYLLLELFREFGVLDGGKRYPVLAELRDAVLATQHGHPESRRAIAASLDAVLVSAGDIFGWRVGWEVEDLARYKIAFDFSGVFVTVQNLLLNALWLPLMFSRIQRGIRNPTMDLYIVCDEAARLCGSAAGTIADTIGAIRGTGIGLDLSVQSADVSRAILSNTGNKFLGRCGCANDYDTMAAAMGLSPQQRRWISTHLETGLFVGQLAEGLREPFLFRVPNLKLTASDDRP